MLKILLEKYIKFSWMVWKNEKFEIDRQEINFYNNEWEVAISLSQQELLESEIFIDCLSKKTWKSTIEFRFLHNNISDLEEFIRKL